MKRVLIRFRADRTIGRGHLARCLPLARALARQGAQVTLAVDASNPYRTELDLAGVRIEVDPTWSHERLETIVRTQHVVVLDVHDVSAEEVAELRQFVPVVGLSAVGPGIASLDLLINPVAQEALDALDTSERVRPRVLTGPDGVIVDHRRLQHVRGSPRAPDRLLVALGGGTGHAANLEAIVSATADDDVIKKIVICTVDDLAVAHERIEVLARPPDFPELLATATVVICGVGTTLYEAASLGTPAIVVPYTAEHLRQARWLQHYNFLRLAHPHASDAIAVCRRLMDDKKVLAEMSKAGQHFATHGTTKTIATEILSLAN